MHLKDLLDTLPGNTRITVRVASDDCPINTGTVNNFLSAGEFLDTVVVAMIPGTTLTIDCRHPGRRRMRHVQILTTNRPGPAKVVSIHRGLMRHAPAGMFLLSDGQISALAERRQVKQALETRAHEAEMMQDSRWYNTALKQADIYRAIMRRGGIQPSPAYRGEYRDDVPVGLRNKRGLPIDEMADELGLSVSDMLEALRNRRKIA